MWIYKNTKMKVKRSNGEEIGGRKWEEDEGEQKGKRREEEINGEKSRIVWT